MKFYGTTSNGKYPVMTAELLEGKGIKKINNEPTMVLEHKCQLHKGLYMYWLTQSAFNKLIKNNNMERACI